VNFLKRLFGLRLSAASVQAVSQGAESLIVTTDELMMYYDQAMRINADQATQLERLKRQINDQARLIADYEQAQADSNERSDWVRRLVSERGDQLGINSTMHRFDAARLALVAVWDALDHYKAENDKLKRRCATLTKQLADKPEFDFVAAISAGQKVPS